MAPGSKSIEKGLALAAAPGSSQLGLVVGGKSIETGTYVARKGIVTSSHMKERQPTSLAKRRNRQEKVPNINTP